MLDPFKEAIKDQQITKERMAEMWCELNSYRVPLEFKETLLPFKFGSAGRASIAMKDIQSIIGIKACLKKWRSIHCKPTQAKG